MELLVQLVERFSEVWRAVNHAPMPFSALGITIFLIGYGIARWYYRREVRVLSALSALLEERIKRDEQQNTRLAALLQPRTGEAFFAIHRAPGHKIAVPYSPAQVTARPEYRLLSDLGMIRIEEAAANQTSLYSTSAAIKLWDTFLGPTKAKV
jgi:hypothetical protein